ncbi:MULTISPECIES: cell envelope biogenesis protein OmpA [Alphaproteobacteria]|uniref:Cell envelope biogenesis protein OmpA n=2 Tax=Alphaproteobacteria TaxID=28211 RepID=A0A512HES0_9HYPH|nr:MULTISPECIES: cell envelope biogenesis protein OmpA [Alphaproteobacteria]GEO83954.1 hypothetical protein RNA01_08860 [Ciceribacter naphthalenivorans]GLR21168.1 hypothetical protein GCM10007920_09540 [Ciceribacter naphthalenivorans]GLT04024.1 hypothetical protein GCM10007926_09540 [Sphingomonas psychrolutea]
MFETAFALSLTQFARSLSFPERLQHRPARNAALEPWRLRNTGLDALLYDVKSLTAEETFYISDSIASEGLIMIVPPSGGDMLTICDNVAEYKLRGGLDVHAMAVAGGGGSAIGAAAFARNVADAIGEPVVAVVSGYGLGDIINETIGGSFFFGWLGHMRNDLELIDDTVGRPHLGAYEDRHKLALKPHPSALDTDTVATMLADPSLSFHLLTGHSRGNRVLSEALYAIKQEDPGRLRRMANGLRIVTFGGRITMPPDCRDVIDVIGELDWFGEINSRPQIASDIRVPLAGHSTNTDLAGAMQVTKVLKDIIARSLPAVPEQAHPPVPQTIIAKAPAVSPAPAPEPEAIVGAESALAAEADVETIAENTTVESEPPAQAAAMPEEIDAVIAETPPVAASSAEDASAPLEAIAEEEPVTAAIVEPTPVPVPAPQRPARRKSASASQRTSKPKGPTRR